MLKFIIYVIIFCMTIYYPVFSETTESFDMSFNTSGSVSIDFDEDTQVVAVKNGADPFTVKVTTGE